jgi:hypothetical protein
MYGKILSLALSLTLSIASARSQTPVKIAGFQVRPHLTLGDTITVAATPANITFALLAGGVTAGSGPVSIITTWSGINLLASMSLYATLGSSTAALSGGTPVVNNIPSRQVYGSDPSGSIVTSMTPFTGTNPINGSTASLLIWKLTSILSLGGSHTDSLSLQIDLTSQPQLPAATYTGTLTLQVQAF